MIKTDSTAVFDAKYALPFEPENNFECRVINSELGFEVFRRRYPLWEDSTFRLEILSMLAVFIAIYIGFAGLSASNTEQGISGIYAKGFNHLLLWSVVAALLSALFTFVFGGIGIGVMHSVVHARVNRRIANLPAHRIEQMLRPLLKPLCDKDTETLFLLYCENERAQDLLEQIKQAYSQVNDGHRLSRNGEPIVDPYFMKELGLLLNFQDLLKRIELLPTAVENCIDHQSGQ